MLGLTSTIEQPFLAVRPQYSLFLLYLIKKKR
nr:MAG TPA: hypothetical protein [Bacteriophage sp.]